MTAIGQIVELAVIASQAVRRLAHTKIPQYHSTIVNLRKWVNRRWLSSSLPCVTVSCTGLDRSENAVIVLSFMPKQRHS